MRKLVAAAAAVVLVFVVLSGCGSSSSSSSSTTSSSTSSSSTTAANASLAAQVPAAIKSKGTLNVATEAQYAPNEFIASDGSTIVGMDADRGVEPWVAPDKVERGCARIWIPARDEDPLDAGQARASEHELHVAGEPVGLDVAVGIDQAHWARP